MLLEAPSLAVSDVCACVVLLHAWCSTVEICAACKLWCWLAASFIIAAAVLQVGGSLRGGELADPDRAPEPPKVKFGEDNPAPGQSGDE
jgi:hypothetical protein